ncbi:MAG: Rpn family recombination-promoting nuclease/putative transposase [Lachnospiraceae bacterium]|nr:Rpn family recombination-promoting nuclease/putative transposase [Candidatus Colinaster scatohippi]
MTEKTEKKFYGMKNDYMFKAVLQENQDVLVNLVATLMRIPEKEIVSCKITNTIELGKSIDAKECVLDIRLVLNGNVTINIELQIDNEGNWPERSLYYWPKSFDTLKAGEDYELLRPTYQIGILDFTLFKDSPEFFSEYKLQNVRNGRVYTDKINIRVLDLTNIELAKVGEEELAHWARIFKAKTMEELKQAAGSTEVMQKMVVTLAKLSEEEKIRQQCEAREKSERDMRSMYKFGVKNGREEGIEIGKEQAILSLVQDGTITLEAAAEKLGISLKEAESKLKNM